MLKFVETVNSVSLSGDLQTQVNSSFLGFMLIKKLGQLHTLGNLFFMAS